MRSKVHRGFGATVSFAVVSHAHRNIFAVNGHPQGARYGGDPHQRSGRDLRLDLFRGLSLIFIFVDHVPDNVLSYLTLQSFSFCDAAECSSSFLATPPPLFTGRLYSGEVPSSPRPRSIAGFGSSTSHTSSCL